MGPRSFLVPKFPEPQESMAVEIMTVGVRSPLSSLGGILPLKCSLPLTPLCHVGHQQGDPVRPQAPLEAK